MTRQDEHPAPKHARVVRVTGGEDVVQLPYADVRVLADCFEQACGRALSGAGRTAAAAGSPDLLLSAALAPTTAATAGAALAAAAAGLAAWSAAIGAHAEAVRAAVALLEQADAAMHAELAGLERAIAFVYGREGIPPDVTATALQVPMSSAAPTDLAAMVQHAAQVAALSGGDHPENAGTVEVQTVTGADGSRRHIVYLPGTDDMNPLHAFSDQVRDMGANVHLEAGVPTAYGAGVLAAMAQAGVRPDEPVLLVGHSQGGMEAMALAVQQGQQGQQPAYDITNVVTMGSPAVPGQLPAQVQALSLEHLGDQVPLLDGRPNDPSPHHVTVTFDSGFDGPVHNHGLPHYVAGALAVQDSTDPSVQHAVQALEPFTAHPGDVVESTVFQIRRQDPVPQAGHTLAGR